MPGTFAPEDIKTWVAQQGFALPRADEWEAACGGGRSTLFHWGDHVSTDHYACINEGWCPLPNGYGLRIAEDTYRPELLDVPGLARGGDAGGMVCGGSGYFVAWLTLSTAWHDPDLTNYEDIDGESYVIRRVLRLAPLGRS